MMLSDVCLTSVCLSVAYTWPKSRRETPMKTKIGTEVAHVTRDSDTTFKVKKVKGQGHRGRGILWRPPAQLVLITIITGRTGHSGDMQIGAAVLRSGADINLL